MLRSSLPLIPRMATTCACAGIALGIVVWASARVLVPAIPASQGFEPLIVNKTKALEIVGTTKLKNDQDDVLRVTLKNISDRKSTRLNSSHQI